MDDYSNYKQKNDISILLEQYKIYVDSALKISQLRQSINTYFLTLNILIFSAFGAASTAGLEGLKIGWSFFVSIAGTILCYYWFRLIKSYKGLSAGKFKIIHRLEQCLPAQIFSDEWNVLEKGENHKNYQPVTSLEMKILLIFSGLYLLLMLWSFLTAIL